MAIERRRESEPDRRKKRDGNDMWQNLGLDVDSMSPKARAATGAIVAGAAVVAALAVFEFPPFVWWTIFVFGWSVFPAFGLFLRGISGTLDSDGVEKLQKAARSGSFLKL